MDDFAQIETVETLPSPTSRNALIVAGVVTATALTVVAVSYFRARRAAKETETVEIPTEAEIVVPNIK
jgi:hypothetical protein